MISIQGVHKRYGKRVAIHPLDLDVPRGVITGLLGHNGAGKSTIIGMLLGQVLPDAGRVTIDKRDVFTDRAHALARVGATFEAPAFYDHLSGERNLRLFCEYSGPPNTQRIAEVVELVDLTDCIRDRVSTYSHGMRQRLALAQALLPDPHLLLLDEPVQGLDPEGIHDFRETILRLNRERGMTILFSSHLLSEVEAMCAHVAILHHGRLLFSGGWPRATGSRYEVKIVVDRQREVGEVLKQSGLVAEFREPGTAVLADGATVASVSQWLAANGFQLQSIAPIGQGLEEFYLDTIRGETR